jgi:hypothetical protein
VTYGGRAAYPEAQQPLELYHSHQSGSASASIFHLRINSCVETLFH